MLIREPRQTVDEEHMAAISRSQEYRARKIAAQMINGSDALQYANVFNYCAETKRTNPNGIRR